MSDKKWDAVTPLKTLWQNKVLANHVAKLESNDAVVEAVTRAMTEEMAPDHEKRSLRLS